MTIGHEHRKSEILRMETQHALQLDSWERGAIVAGGDVPARRSPAWSVPVRIGVARIGVLP